MSELLFSDEGPEEDFPFFSDFESDTFTLELDRVYTVAQDPVARLTSQPPTTHGGEAGSVIARLPSERHGCTGAVVWNCGVVLAQLAVARHSRSSSALNAYALAAWPRPLASLRVLELGAGCGLLAAVLARAGATVVATDCAAALPLLRVNLERNAPPVRMRPFMKGCARAQLLDWHDLASVAALDASSFDCIVAADCIYDDASAPLLVAVLRAAWCTDSTQWALISYDLKIGRGDTWARFQDIARAAGFNVEPLDVGTRSDIAEEEEKDEEEDSPAAAGASAERRRSGPPPPAAIGVQCVRLTMAAGDETVSGAEDDDGGDDDDDAPTIGGVLESHEGVLSTDTSNAQ